MHVDYYFDYLSGYAYIGWLRLRDVCAERDVEIRIHPTLFAGLLNHWGQLGPAEIEPKRAWVYRDGYRYAKKHGIELNCPRHHPFNPLPALRLSLPEVGGSDQAAIVDAIWRAGWGRGIDLGSPVELARALTEVGLDGEALVERTSDPAVKEALKQQTADAVARGVFGVPTYIVGDQLIWGADRIEYVEMILDGEDTMDEAWLAEVLSRPRAADRRG